MGCTAIILAAILIMKFWAFKNSMVCLSKYEVIHAVNLGKAAFLAVEKPKGYPFSEVVKKGTDDFRCSLGKYISQYGMFWQMPLPWIDAIRHYSEESFPQLGIGAYIAAGYCANILTNLAEGKEVKYFPKFYLSPLLEEI